MRLKELKPNPDNPRSITKAQFEKLKKSIEEFPEMLSLRPIIIDDDNIVLGGNMRLKVLEEMGYTDLPDEWVKRASSLTKEQKREFIIKDNIPFGEWDWEILANEWEPELLNDWGLTVPDENEGPTYSNKIEAPNYEPLNEKPDVKTLYDIERYKKLCEAIDKSKATKDEKEFLKLAAGRHIVFNYSWIADYYAHSDKMVQELMEQSALVIIDFDKAIKEGYVELTEQLNKLFEQDYGDAGK